MKLTLLKALLGLVPIVMLFSGAALMFLRTKSGSSLLQLLGAVCLGIVVVAHTCEALGLFPSMGWGEEQSIGHYLDLGSAVLGLTLFSVGYLSHALASRLR
jgi:hypothetical protein